MITPSDPEYEATKRIKQGKEVLSAPFDELARWISVTWQVAVLNVIYHPATSTWPPRLEVIVEYRSNAPMFRKGVNPEKEKLRAIANKFIEIVGRYDVHRFDVRHLFVFFSAFAPLAKVEADSQIKDSDIELLKVRIGNPDLWEVSRCFGHVTFFFFTSDQAKRYQALGMRAEYARMYFDLLKPHDEFGYVTKDDFSVDFDSKQNLDENYQGNWFFYYK